MHRQDWLFYTACLFAGPVDILISLPNWHLESNPIALWLGPILLVAVKLSAIGIGLYLWTTTEIDTHPVGIACAGFLCLLYTLVVIGNVFVLL